MWGAILGFIGLIYVVAARPQSYALNSSMRECPHCLEPMQRLATVCPHCQRDSSPWADDPPERHSSFDVVLLSAGRAAPERLVPELTDLAGLSKKEARQYIEQAPITLIEAVSREEAELVQRDL